MTPRQRNAKRRNERQNTRSVRAVSTVRSSSPLLMMMVSFMVLLGAALWHFTSPTFEFSINFTKRETKELGPEQFGKVLQSHINPHFNMSGVRIGMTPEIVKKIYPNAKQGVSRTGEPILTVKTARGLLVAWLYESDLYFKVGEETIHEQIARIYRMRLDEVYPVMTEQDILIKYGQNYGRPIEAACTRAQLGDSPRCNYRWWGGEGISIEATAKKKIDVNGRTYTMLTTTAENTLKSAKMASLAP